MSGDKVDADAAPQRERALDLLNVHTHYYLAQVFEKTGQRDKAAECCHFTLRRQLELKELRPVEWATNAATLSHHYVACNKFRAAKHHIAAAKFVIGRFKDEMESTEFEDVEEKSEVLEAIERCSAVVSRTLGQYSRILLQKSQDKAMQNDVESPLVVEDIESGDDQVHDSDCDFPSIEIDAESESLPIKLATSFEEAREIFLPGQRGYRKAQEYFSFEERCSDFTEINQDLSVMHKILAFFERDLDRRFKIHKRRVDLLEAPLKQLGRTAYLLVCRQLLFELGETYESMMDVKLDMLGETEAVEAPFAAKVNALIAKSLFYFEEYLSTLKDGDGRMPSTFSADTVRTALVAHFHMARLSDKCLVAGDEQQRLRNKMQAYLHFKAIVDYCAQHKEAVGVVAAELPICQDMVRLLPVKIEKMKASMRSAGQS